MLSFKGQTSFFHQKEIHFFYHHLLKGQPFFNDLFQHLPLKINWLFYGSIFLNPLLCCINLLLYPHDNYNVLINTVTIVNLEIIGAPGWLSWLSVRLPLRSWSHTPWVWAPHQALCWQLRAWSLLQICVSPSLCPSPANALSLSVSKINKNI